MREERGDRGGEEGGGRGGRHGGGCGSGADWCRGLGGEGG